jgi:hypothetical protein
MQIKASRPKRPPSRTRKAKKIKTVKLPIPQTRMIPFQSSQRPTAQANSAKYLQNPRQRPLSPLWCENRPPPPQRLLLRASQTLKIRRPPSSSLRQRAYSVRSTAVKVMGPKRQSSKRARPRQLCKIKMVPLKNSLRQKLPRLPVPARAKIHLLEEIQDTAHQLLRDRQTLRVRSRL